MAELNRMDRDIGRATLEILKKVEKGSGSKTTNPSVADNPRKPINVDEESETAEMGPSDGPLEIMKVAVWNG